MLPYQKSNNNNYYTCYFDGVMTSVQNENNAY